MRHTDEKGKFDPAQSKVAKRMRGEESPEGYEGLSYLLGDKSKVGVIGKEEGKLNSNGFSFLRAAASPEGYEGHRVLYSENNDILGAMQIMKTPNSPYTVANAYVHHNHRRRGIAGRLNHAAVEKFGQLARSEGPSELGAAFRQSLGL